MKEYPILFRTKMVKAIWEERKNMTRRLVKRRPLEWLMEDFTPEFVALPENYLCPYGYEGDDLWVRETWQHGSDSLPYIYRAGYPKNVPKEIENVPYLKDIKWKPSIFMPKIACRTWLHNLGVRIERLQDITEEDAIAEGIQELIQSSVQLAQNGRQFFDYSGKPELFNEGLTAIESFKSLWVTIHGKESWDENPWLWVIKFTKYERDTNS